MHTGSYFGTNQEINEVQRKNKDAEMLWKEKRELEGLLSLMQKSLDEKAEKFGLGKGNGGILAENALLRQTSGRMRIEKEALEQTLDEMDVNLNETKQEVQNLAKKLDLVVNQLREKDKTIDQLEKRYQRNNTSDHHDLSIIKEGDSINDVSFLAEIDEHTTKLENGWEVNNEQKKNSHYTINSPTLLITSSHTPPQRLSSPITQKQVTSQQQSYSNSNSRPNSTSKSNMDNTSPQQSGIAEMLDFQENLVKELKEAQEIIEKERIEKEEALKIAESEHDKAMEQMEIVQMLTIQIEKDKRNKKDGKNQLSLNLEKEIEKKVREINGIKDQLLLSDRQRESIIREKDNYSQKLEYLQRNVDKLERDIDTEREMKRDVDNEKEKAVIKMSQEREGRIVAERELQIARETLKEAQKTQELMKEEKKMEEQIVQDQIFHYTKEITELETQLEQMRKEKETEKQRFYEENKRLEIELARCGFSGFDQIGLNQNQGSGSSSQIETDQGGIKNTNEYQSKMKYNQGDIGKRMIEAESISTRLKQENEKLKERINIAEKENIQLKEQLKYITEELHESQQKQSSLEDQLKKQKSSSDFISKISTTEQRVILDRLNKNEKIEKESRKKTDEIERRLHSTQSVTGQKEIEKIKNELQAALLANKQCEIFIHQLQNENTKLKEISNETQQSIDSIRVDKMKNNEQREEVEKLKIQLETEVSSFKGREEELKRQRFQLEDQVRSLTQKLFAKDSNERNTASDFEQQAVMLQSRVSMMEKQLELQVEKLKSVIEERDKLQDEIRRLRNELKDANDALYAQKKIALNAKTESDLLHIQLREAHDNVKQAHSQTLNGMQAEQQLKDDVTNKTLQIQELQSELDLTHQRLDGLIGSPSDYASESFLISKTDASLKQSAGKQRSIFIPNIGQGSYFSSPLSQLQISSNQNNRTSYIGSLSSPYYSPSQEQKKIAFTSYSPSSPIGTLSTSPTSSMNQDYKQKKDHISKSPISTPTPSALNQSKLKESKPSNIASFTGSYADVNASADE
ncbi:MAG: hypothetical protein EZS28_013511 [Streblomastix strix]|uniref:Uncharacterized protein n=1 Tax=Streblomastix strix TaxID=222440 RepID=A0A5J4W8M2_9EUKA|nr:MAG: hypothetical protein EZS28_013511 [Streblomastix strix]